MSPINDKELQDVFISRTSLILEHIHHSDLGDQLKLRFMFHIQTIADELIKSRPQSDLMIAESVQIETLLIANSKFAISGLGNELFTYALSIRSFALVPFLPKSNNNLKKAEKIIDFVAFWGGMSDPMVAYIQDNWDTTDDAWKCMILKYFVKPAPSTVSAKFREILQKIVSKSTKSEQDEYIHEIAKEILSTLE